MNYSIFLRGADRLGSSERQKTVEYSEVGTATIKQGSHQEGKTSFMKSS